ncbi:MAG: Xaa-Pro peptidase family protein [Thermoleophilaceae bacterium]
MTRADRLEALVGERELDALLVSSLVDVRYLTGFTGSNAICLVGPELRIFLTDFRYLTQAAAQVEGFDRRQGRQDLLAEAAELMMSGRVGFDDGELSVRRHERLREAAGDGVELVAAGGLVERLRAVKEPGELAAIRAAAALADDALAAILERGLVGRSEREVALDLEQDMRLRGAQGPSFPSIVASAARGALPHAEPSPARIEAGELVTIDFGAILDGYCSDCTRTFATGELSEEARSTYELVLAAQQRAVAAVRAGVGGKELDGVAREVIVEGGHRDHFGHGLGHGVGLEVHEGPRLSPLSGDTLAAGNVVTIEPGVYLPDRLGVRIEDLVFVEDGGCEIVSRLPKQIETVG